MDSITRRRFLEQSLLAATVGLGMAAHNESTAQADSRSGRPLGANDRIRIALIGVNGRGMDHLKGYVDKPDVDIVAICDPDLNAIARAQAAVEKKGKAKPEGVQDIRRLLENKDIDAVSIATPNHWHTLAALWAMQSGKDVYVEKPVSHNVTEGRRLVQAAKKYDRICQAGTQSRSHKAMQEAMAYIHDGKIGKVSLARGLCYKPRNSIGKVDAPQPIPDGIDYDLWLGPAPQKPLMRKHLHYDWHWQWDYGNGDLGNQGIHQMDIARWALNKSGLPLSVMAVGGRFGYVDDGETPNTQIALYDYGDCHLIFEVRGLKTEAYQGVGIGNIIYGTDGYVAITADYSKAAAFDRDNKKVQEFTGAGDHFGNFLSVVHSRKVSEQNAPILEGHVSSALCHLGNISYRLGSLQPFSKQTQSFGDDKESVETFERMTQHLKDNNINLMETDYRVGPTLKLDAGKERFVGNKAANAMLTREYRKPFAVPDKV